MKKLFFTAVIALCGLGLSNAQDGQFGVGFNAAMPIGDFGDFATFGIGLEATYMYPVSESLMVGGNAGYMNYFGEDLGSGFEVDDFQLIPIAASAIFNLGDSGFGAGADVGYALGVSDNVDGAFMYEPKVVYNTESLMFSLGYQGISDVIDLNSIQLGAIYKF